jgi:Tol biopolymer transport system component
LTPSYWHGVSPDGKTIVYCAARNGNYDIYSMSSNGGDEIRLTTTDGLDDGPEYSPDGKYIYINSYRSGMMQIWRMKADGSDPEQMTFDAHSNWFAHIAPNNKVATIITYMEDQKQAHPFGHQVKLRLLNLKTKEVKDLTEAFYGGQGTINVPSWSPDGKQFAYVRYALEDL